MFLFLRRHRKVMESKGYNLAEHEGLLWDAWKDVSLRAKELWATEEDADPDVGEGGLRFVDALSAAAIHANGELTLSVGGVLLSCEERGG